MQLLLAFDRARLHTLAEIIHAFLTRPYKVQKSGVAVRATTGARGERGMAKVERDEVHAESYDAAQLAVRVREIDRCREHTSTV